MKVYFVRHGESDFNVKNLHQHPDVQLTAKGIEQAEYVAERISNIKIDHMFASPYLRAEQTAEIIAKKINKKIEFVDLIVELKRPSELVGYTYSDPFALSVKQKQQEHVDDPEWHYSDEENFFDFRKRALSFVRFLEKQFSNESILVVTHGHFMRMLIAVMLDHEIGPDLLRKLETFLVTRNTGITLVEKRPDRDWKLLTWNDHAHLG